MRRMCLVGFLLLIPLVAAAQTAGDSDVPRTPWEAPDLRGIWDNRTITSLERPRQFAGKETLTAKEATAHEAATAEQRVRCTNTRATRATTACRASSWSIVELRGPRPSADDAPSPRPSPKGRGGDRKRGPRYVRGSTSRERNGATRASWSKSRS